MSVPVPWTFAIGGDVSEQLEWLTDVLPAATGPVQTRRLREEAWVQLKFDGQESVASRRWLENQIWHHGAGSWLVPLPMDAQALTSSLVAGSTTVPADTMGPRFVAPGRALLHSQDPSQGEVVTLSDVQPGELTLAAPTIQTWPAGTRLTPLRLADLVSVPALARFTSDATGIYTAQFRLSESLGGGEGWAPPTYRGAPVLEWRPVWTSDPQWAPEREVVTANHDVAPPLGFDLVGMPLHRLVLSLAASGRTEMQTLRGLLLAMAGRWSPAWVPTWAHDLRLAANVVNGAITLDVQGPLLSRQALGANRRDVRIALHDGTVLYRRVTQAQLQNPTTDRLTLDSTITTGFTVGQVAMISFLSLCRQDSDINLLRYFNAETMLCELTFRGEAHGL